MEILSMTRQQLEEALEQEGLNFSVRPTYTGRGMSEPCFALVGSEANDLYVGHRLADAFTAAGIGSNEAVDELLAGARIDNMGMGWVYYFPGFRLDGEEA